MIRSTRRRLECLGLVQRIGKEEKDFIDEAVCDLHGANSIKGGKGTLVPFNNLGSKGLQRIGKDGAHVYSDGVNTPFFVG
ncbi:hypothetical protein SLEP1_g9209 [Rubroshorea leprosula]|uniref:Uncharacterized protein n=1 Tax=Rubroshorea leprosula TaxID=152421 RepID=A0AAV5ICK8_9ROSI|nr:hypothetical protein SLEP1_g9209 [Rubroshorea leprosula]